MTKQEKIQAITEALQNANGEAKIYIHNDRVIVMVGDKSVTIRAIIKEDFNDAWSVTKHPHNLD